jgi:hypothetical protein
VSDSSGVDNRKDLLLLVLAAAGGDPVVGVTRLQKYLYLLQEQEGWRERLGPSRYDFRAYDFGPFDDQIYADIDFLENVGLIAKDPAGEVPLSESGEEQQASESWATSDPEFAPWTTEKTIWAYRLTEQGRQFVEANLELSDADAEAVEKMKARWNATPLTEFLRWLYTEYPDVAKNTKLKHLAT